MGWQNVFATILHAGNTIINPKGLFVYSTTPGAGDLAASMAGAAGTDDFGNTVNAGVTAYGTSGTYVEMIGGTPARIFIATGDAAESQPGGGLSAIFGAGLTRQLITIFESALVSGVPTAHVSQLQLYSVSPDQSQLAKATLLAGSNIQSSQVTVLPTGTTVTGPLTATSGSVAQVTQVSTDSNQSLGTPSIANTSVNRSRYSLMANSVASANQVHVEVQITATAALVAGLYTFSNTLPTAYQFPGNFRAVFPLAAEGVTLAAGTNQLFIAVDGAATANPGRVQIQVPALVNGTHFGATFCFTTS